MSSEEKKAMEEPLGSSYRQTHQDKQVLVDQVDERQLWKNTFVQRLVAKGKTFRNVDFSYSIFDHCYFRKCRFDSCNFTGCKFLSTNFEGSHFTECKFNYTHFERTNIESTILDDQCPPFENVKQRFARTLRINYQSLGDVEGVNKAMRVEMEATILHYHKAWKSNELFYREKHKGFDRVKLFFKWLEYKSLEFIWGNGESIWKLMRFVIISTLLMSIIDLYISHECFTLWSLIHSFFRMPQILLAVSTPSNYPVGYLSFLVFFRLLFFALFVSVFVRRLSRR
jgi:hypothetical protein